MQGVSGRIAPRQGASSLRAKSSIRRDGPCAAGIMKATLETGSPLPGQGRHSRSGPDCPHCKGLAYRIPRRFADQVLSIFVLVHRYRCRSIACGWEGLLRATEKSLPGGSRQSTYDGRRRLLEPSRMDPMTPSEKLGR